MLPGMGRVRVRESIHPPPHPPRKSLNKRKHQRKSEMIAFITRLEPCWARVSILQLGNVLQHLWQKSLPQMYFCMEGLGSRKDLK